MELSDAGRRLARIARDGFAVPIVERLADRWVTVTRSRVRVDTGELRASTHVASIGGTKSHAEAIIDQSADHAGWNEFGTRRMPPRPAMRDGRDAAAALARELESDVASELRRILT